MDRKEFNRMGIIFSISLIIQLLFIFIARIAMQGDAVTYDIVAMNLIEGKGFSEDKVAPALLGHIKYGYTLFLALIYKIFGHSILIVKIIQAFLVSLTGVITYKIGKKLFDERIGYCSALITIFHPAFLIISSHIVSESLFTLLLTLSILYLIVAMKRKSLKLYLISGIFLGISMQIRFTPVFLPFFIIAGLLLFYKDKLYAFKAGVIIFSAVIVITIPWAIRDCIHFGYFNPFIEQGGSLWIGSYTKGDAHQDNPGLRKAVSELIDGVDKRYAYKKTSPSSLSMELQKVSLKLAFENIKNDPLGYISLFPKKVWRLWIGSYSGLFNINVTFSEFVHSRDLITKHPFILLWKMIVYLFSLAVFFLGLAGMIIGVRKWKEISPLYIIVVYFTLLHMAVFANTRLGIPALPCMIIFASLALSKLLERKRSISLF